MNSEHMAYFGLDFLLAGSCMSEEERVAVREVVKDRIEPKGQRKEDGMGAKTPQHRYETDLLFSCLSFLLLQVRREPQPGGAVWGAGRQDALREDQQEAAVF